MTTARHVYFVRDTRVLQSPNDEKEAESGLHPNRPHALQHISACVIREHALTQWVCRYAEASLSMLGLELEETVITYL